MTKEQAIHSFWNSFKLPGSLTTIPAYDENTVPDGATFPYITYEVVTNAMGYDVISSASIWDRSTSWKGVTDILEVISEEIGLGGTTRRYDNGLMWVKKGYPFSRRVPDDSQNIRHISMNIETEFISQN